MVCILCRWHSLPTIRDRHWQTLAAKFENAKLEIQFCLHGNGCLFMWDAYFCMGAYKPYVVVVIKMGAYTHGVLIIPII